MGSGTDELISQAESIIFSSFIRHAENRIAAAVAPEKRGGVREIGLLY